MKNLIVIGIALIIQCASGQVLNVTQQTLVDSINNFIGRLNTPIYNIHFMGMTHCDNSVRTLTESLHNFNMWSNEAYWPVADVNRTVLQQCLTSVRDTLEPVLQYLRMRSNAPIFDYTTSTESPIEADVKQQTDELKKAIWSKTDAKCLSNSQITSDNLISKYSNYKTNVTSCINTLKDRINTNYVNIFNPQHFPALDLLNNMGTAVNAITTRTQVVAFLTKYCVPSTTALFKSVQSSVESFLPDNAKNITRCAVAARPTLPTVTPYLDVVNKCA